MVALIFSPWGYLGVAVFAASYIIGWWIIGRQVRAHRYLEGDEDFFRGPRALVAQRHRGAYGRIQFIDVDERPLSRLFGLATLKLNTASASSDARLSGLPRAEALAIRQRLSDKPRGANGRSVMANQPEGGTAATTAGTVATNPTHATPPQRVHPLSPCCVAPMCLSD